MKSTKFTKTSTEDEDNNERVAMEGKAKKVVIDSFDAASGAGPLVALTAYERLKTKMQAILDTRAQLEIHEKIENNLVNVTPKPLFYPSVQQDFSQLATITSKTQQMEDADLISFRSGMSSIMKIRSSKSLGYNMSLDDIIYAIGNQPISLDAHTSSFRLSTATTSLDSVSSLELDIAPKPHRNYIRIVLRKTELKLLYEQHGITAIKNTEDANVAEIDNKNYDYLTIGRGKVRLRSEAETQTPHTLFKSRDNNTDIVPTKNVASYVSYFEMFDTYKMLQNDVDDDNNSKKLSISQIKTPEEQFIIIAQLPSFHLASVIIKRLLAGNTFEKSQKKFRNMMKVTRTVDKISYKYSVNNLFAINPAYTDGERKAVADMSFCSANGDILAVAYGIFTYRAAKLPKTGEVCIWSIKNSCDPERSYQYTFPVVSVEFSPYIPKLLAIGLFDGSIEVRDITFYNQPPLAITKRTSTCGVDPVLDIKWFKQNIDSDNEIDPFLALSQDGSVTQYSIINSPYLSSFKLMSLERLEGVPEGLDCTKADNGILIHSNRSPQGLCLTKHPTQLDIYYILTDEGCIHKCSTNYQHHYIQALKTHEGSVNHMDFSPWSPKLFLTCGNDWCIRIWMDGILEPLFTLKNLCKPYNWAKWSLTHSIILVAINDVQCEIWDLRRSTLKPMSVTDLNTSKNTTGIFSLDGNSILIGKERGDVMVNSIDEMPFPAYYQYDTLETCLYNALSNNPDLLRELKTLGYFGYPYKNFFKSS